MTHQDELDHAFDTIAELERDVEDLLLFQDKLLFEAKKSKVTINELKAQIQHLELIASFGPEGNVDNL